jgi:hypothetical protein
MSIRYIQGPILDSIGSGKSASFSLEKSTTTLVHAFIISHLDYCNALLSGIPATVSRQIQQVLNAAARVVCLVPKFDHISPVLIHLHWLPTPYRVQYKILLLVFKCLLGEAPEYLRLNIQPKRKGRHSLRSESAVLLEVPRVRHSTIGRLAFAFTAPNLWNKLPTQLRNTKSLQTKSLLKAHLFAAAFGDNST